MWVGNGNICTRGAWGVNHCYLLPLLSGSPVGLNASKIHPARDKFSLLPRICTFGHDLGRHHVIKARDVHPTHNKPKNPHAFVIETVYT